MSELTKKVFELFGKPELGAERESNPAKERPRFSSPWPCERCGNPAEIEAIESSLDGLRTLTYWHCPTCQAWAVTPDALRQPPTWVRKSEQ
jgi:rubredoxin